MTKKSKRDILIPSDIDGVAAIINKNFGKGTILRASDAKSLRIKRVSFGVFALDIASGGGVPRGRITMLHGDKSTGKSCIAMKIAAEFQRCDRLTGKPYLRIDSGGEIEELDFGRSGEPQPMNVVWVDLEHTFEIDWARKWGIDTDYLYVVQPASSEEAIDICDGLIRSNKCDLVIVDSIAALSPSAEIEGASGEVHMGLNARLFNQALRKWTSGLNACGLLSETQCSIVLINQFRLKIGGGVVYKTTPCGEGHKYFASIEIVFTKKDFINDPITNRPIGILVEFMFKKNKTAPPMRGGQYEIYFVNSDTNDGIGSTGEIGQIFDFAKYWGLIKSSGKWVSFNPPIVKESIKIDGKKKTIEFLYNHPEIVSKLKEQVLDLEYKWREEGVTPVSIGYEEDISNEKA